MGQSFWSRGPSLSAPFTAKDYPSLRPLPSVSSEDYSALLHATLELTQILYNAHGTLYSSSERTTTLVQHGDYARYLDDFVKAASIWHAASRDVPVSDQLKATLLIMYEYVCLYVNAFAFQAVHTRASKSKASQSGRSPAHNGYTRPQKLQLFPAGIMAIPDGRYIFDAISAAKSLLRLISDLNPSKVLRYLPSRYYMWVYSPPSPFISTPQ